ncbi:MAG: DUF721 domain-containing protein [bacterium]
MKNFAHVKDGLNSVLKKLGITTDNYAVFEIWEKEAGVLARACKDIYIRNKILYIYMESPVHMQELMLRKNDIIKKINNHFAKPVVRDMRCKPAR